MFLRWIISFKNGKATPLVANNNNHIAPVSRLRKYTFINETEKTKKLKEEEYDDNMTKQMTQTMDYCNCPNSFFVLIKTLCHKIKLFPRKMKLEYFVLLHN